MAGIRPIGLEDPERDPEYERALEHFYAVNVDAPGAAEYRAAGAPARPADVGGIRVRPAAMLADMATGANGHGSTPEQDQASRSAAIMEAARLGADITPLTTQRGPGARQPPTRMTPTPAGEALYADLQQAAAQTPDEPPALPESHWMRRIGSAVGEGAKSLGRSVLGAIDDPTRHEWWDAPGSMTPEMPLPVPPERPPEPAPAAVPARMLADVSGARPTPRTLRVGRAVETTTPNVVRIASAAPPVPSGDITSDHPAVRRIVEEATSRTQVAPDTATAGRSELEAALQDSSQRRLLARLTRAGAAAVGGGRGPAYDALAAEADRPLQELALRRADVVQQQGRAAQAADADPASPQSQMARSLASRLAPGIENEPWFRKASYSSLSRGPLGKMLEQAGDIQRERVRAQAKRGTGGMGGLKRAELERFTQKAAKETQGFADMQADLGTVLQAAQSPDVEGIGPGAGLLPDMLTSAQGTENRRAARRLVENLLRAQSGLAASDREQVRKLASTSLSDRASDADWIAGAKELARFAQKGMRTREAAFPPEAIDLLEQRGGTTSRNILPSGEGDGPVRMRAPDGRVKLVPPEQVEAAKAAGGVVL